MHGKFQTEQLAEEQTQNFQEKLYVKDMIKERNSLPHHSSHEITVE